ncbi:hypothetical protein AB1Y20_005218 [Prymnesium parvum]|uniref:Protein kinase domain-containing protein n=1 Tax=Prymnesium parvum TaxID=97485 RepID=A0AB34J342_PRYPA
MAEGGSSSQDDRFHTMSCKGIPFTVPKKFAPYRMLGQGAFGVVCAARADGQTEEVAIKKVLGAVGEHTHIVEGKRALRELLLLRHLQHENVSCISDAWTSPAGDLYLVSDVMDSDMHRIISSPQPLSEDHCQWFVYQILRGLKYVHSANVIHRDLKPSNLLLNANCDLKITDFGLARAIDEDCGSGGIMTQYVVTRWYRAPEILLFARRYTKAVDVWSTGCIFAELLRRRPMYQGRDQLHQLQLILHQMGTPTAEDLSRVDPRLQMAISTLPPSAGKSLRSIIPHASDAALDLLDSMLQFNPDRRLTAEQALAHPFLASLHDPESEPVHSEPFTTLDIEEEDLDWPTVRSMIFTETEIWNQRNGRPLQGSSTNTVSASDALSDTDVDMCAAGDSASAVRPLCKRDSTSSSLDDTEGAKRMRGGEDM